MAPEVFDAHGAHSRVHRQPGHDASRTRALQALMACPTGSIGTTATDGLRDLTWPRPFDGDRVFHCGFHSEASFGATSWLLRHPDGNVLVDSPRFTPRVVKGLEALGGVRWMFLTHRDDVADHRRFAAHFRCERILHEADRSHETADVERLLTGTEPEALAPGLTLIPTPGHTRGSVCLHAEDRWLFTGDTLAAADDGTRLKIFRDATWYSTARLRQSLARLATLRFRWVLPGHGAPFTAPPEAMRQQLEALADGR